jgi:hypothetical protein
MRNTLGLSLVAAAMLVAGAPLTSIDARGQQKPNVSLPQPGVPEIYTMEAHFVRAAYNNEGYVILGYEPVNRSIGEQWVLLDIGLTLRDGQRDFKLTRDALSLETPDGKTLPLPTVNEWRAGNTSALQARAKVQRDSINYFPPSANRPCRIGFFADLDSGAMTWDEVEVSNTRACLGRIYFHVPGGIAYGQHWLNVKFPQSVVRVPFRILTKDEEKLLNKNYKSIKKQVEEQFKRK